MPITNERSAELAALPDAIDTSDFPEAKEEFFRAAKLRQLNGLNFAPSVEVSVLEQKASSAWDKES